MRSRETTVALLIAVILAMMWATGRIQKIMGAVFGGKK